MKFLWENFHSALCLKYLNKAIIRSSYKNKYSQKNFCGALENCENRESLAQRIFPPIQYMFPSI